MLTKGKLTSGKRSIPSLVIDTTPSTMKLMMIIVAKTGRRMETFEIHMERSESANGNRVHPGACSDLTARVGEDDVAGRQAGGDLNQRAVAQTLDDRQWRDGVTGHFHHHA